MVRIARNSAWLATASVVAMLCASPAAAEVPGAATTAPGYAPSPRAPQGAPNVLIILTDDVGFAASSTFGGPIPTLTFDALAAQGLRYNRFHTTALCSPTRAALLTGRNHHAVNAGVVSEIATGRPGYNGVLPDDAVTFGRVLKDNGYSTAFIGKNHSTPDWESGPSGPFERWPNGFGFDYFFGFNGGETNQWAPALVENRNLIEPPTNDPKYILDHDLADRTVNWLRTQNSTAPDKPFLVYYAPGTAHGPHHAPREWIDRFKGQFDQGWDKMREETFARQKKLGVIPAGAKLTPRPSQIPAWDSLSADQKKLYARMMEVYAGALAYSDNQMSRVIDEIRQEGKLDNTLIIYIQGDNGASAEGGLGGTTNEMAGLGGIYEPTEFTLSKIDTLGGPMAFGHYPVGWAWAMDTPFQWAKQVASHLGGVRNGMVVSWPARIKDVGQVRSQFAHVVDIAPTLYDAIGIKIPASVDGVAIKPLDGKSLAASFSSKTAPGRDVQYFEMFGNRSIYDHGWMASTTPERYPWTPGKDVDAAKFKWELYNLDKDFSQADDLAAKFPKKLAELQATFEREAQRNHVLPVQASIADRLSNANRPSPLGGKSELRFYPSETRYPNGVFPDIRNRSWKISAAVKLGTVGESGTVVTQGGRFGGWGLVMLGGKPTFAYKRSSLPEDQYRLESPTALGPGAHRIDVDFAYDGGGMGQGGVVTMSVDGAEVGKTRLEKTVAGAWSLEGAAIGWDSGTPVLEDYRVPFPLAGVEHVDFTLK